MQDDFNGPSQEGIGYYQFTQKNARRASAATAYLKPAKRRQNLTIKYNTQSRRLIFEGENIVGVETMTGQIFHAEREVVLTAAAIGSPKLLFQSGIGPADHLREISIKIPQILPGVGSNLQDHLDLFVISECTGPVASALFSQGGFCYADENTRSPDVQFHFGLGSGIEAGVAAMKNGGATLNSAFMRPRSRGTVRLKLDNPNHAPR